MTSPRSDVGVAVVGLGWMGRVHARAYTRVNDHFPQVSRRPYLVAAADDVADRESVAAHLGFARFTRDWRTLLDDPAIEAVSITAPNFAHREMATAFAAAGRHVWIEKPVGVDAADALAVAEAVRDAAVQSTVGFNYRNAPAVEEARRLLSDGAIGEVTHAAFRMLGDYAADSEGAFTWRYELGRAGHGVVGDLASHAVDMVRHLLGEVDAVVADSETFVRRRRRPESAPTGHGRSTDGVLTDVENEDWMAAVLRLRSGARVVLETSRVAVGHQNDYGFRIHGTRGVLEWDYRRMGELGIAVGEQAQDLAVATRFVGPESGDFGAFQPGAGNPLSYDDLKVVEARSFLRAIETQAPQGATIEDAVAAAHVLGAIVASARLRASVSVPVTPQKGIA